MQDTVIVYRSRTEAAADQWYYDGGYQYVAGAGILFLIIVSVFFFLTAKRGR